MPKDVWRLTINNSKVAVNLGLCPINMIHKLVDEHDDNLEQVGSILIVRGPVNLSVLQQRYNQGKAANHDRFIY